MARNGSVFIGIGGTVVALDRSTGEEVWRAHLRGSDFVNVAMAEGDLYATAKGELYCLDPATGHVRWQNPLKGLGRGLISIAASDNQAVLMQEKKRRDEEAAGATAVP